MTQQPITVQELIHAFSPDLAHVCENPARDLRMLMACVEGRTHALNTSTRTSPNIAAPCPPDFNHDYYFFHPDYVLSPEIYARIIPLILRLKAFEPLSKIIGQREFYSRRFFINEHTLDPRADTEVLVDGILQFLPHMPRPLHILDLGTGSGCIVLTLMKEIHARTGEIARGVGVDICESALDIAQKNAVSFEMESQVDWIRGSWCEPLDLRLYTNKFSCIVSNPPYIRRDERLDTRVLNYDPHGALFAGTAGTEAYEALVPSLPHYLAPGGIIGVEFGQGQAHDVHGVFETHGWSVSPLCRTLPVHDIQGIERCAFFQQQNK